MSNKTPFMISAPRLVLKISNQDIAYAIGLNCSVSVSLQPVFVLGSVAGVSLEPMLYPPVVGTLQIYRLAQIPNTNLQEAILKQNKASGLLASDAQLSILSSQGFGTAPDTTGPATNSLLSQAQLHTHLDPSTVFASRTFDLEIYMNVPKYAIVNGIIQQSVQNQIPFLTIQDCRITGRNTNLALGQLVNEPLSFQGLLAVNTTLADPEQSDYIKDGVIAGA